MINQTNRLEVDVDLPLSDLYRATIGITVYVLRYIIGALAASLLVCLLCWVYASFGTAQSKLAENVAEVLLPPLVGGVPVLVVGVLAVPYFRAKKILKAERMHGKRHYVFSPEGLSVESSLASANLKWSVFRLVKETRRYFLLYSVANTANVIPKRCFASEPEIGSFRLLVREQVHRVKLRG
jgi:hypothetical protein